MKKNRWVSIAFLFLLPLVIIQCTSNDKALLKKLKEMAENLNTSTPIMLDQYTRFDSASATNGKIFQYYYTILNTSEPEILIKNKKEEIEKSIHLQIISNPDLQIFRNNDITLQYLYRDSDKNMLHVINISPDKYKEQIKK